MPVHLHEGNIGNGLSFDGTTLAMSGAMSDPFALRARNLSAGYNYTWNDGASGPSHPILIDDLAGELIIVSGSFGATTINITEPRTNFTVRIYNQSLLDIDVTVDTSAGEMPGDRKILPGELVELHSQPGGGYRLKHIIKVQVFNFSLRGSVSNGIWDVMLSIPHSATIVTTMARCSAGSAAAALLVNGAWDGQWQFINTSTTTRVQSRPVFQNSRLSLQVYSANNALADVTYQVNWVPGL